MKLAVHLHLYYFEQLPEILGYLKSLSETDYDLFVTMVEENEKVISEIKVVYPNAHIMIVPNYGYDVGPFIEFLHQIDLDKYDYILKIHSKKDVSKNRTRLNGNRMDNRLWKKILFDALLKDAERVQNNLALGCFPLNTVLQKKKELTKNYCLKSMKL